MSPRDLADDLAYVRTVAEEGRQAPLLGGSWLVFWGVLTAAAWVAQWALLTGRLADGAGWSFAALWAGYGVAAGLGMALLRRRLRDRPGQAAIGNRVERAVWVAAAWALLAITTGAIGRMALAGDYRAPDAIAVAAFAIYGLALMTTAGIAKETWLAAFAFLSFIIAAILGVYLISTWFYLAAAAGVVLVLVLPGVILLNREPATTV